MGTSPATERPPVAAVPRRHALRRMLRRGSVRVGAAPGVRCSPRSIPTAAPCGPGCSRDGSAAIVGAIRDGLVHCSADGRIV